MRPCFKSTLLNPPDILEPTRAAGGIRVSTAKGQRVTTIKEKLKEATESWWLVVVLGVPFGILWAKHGYVASMRDGDFFLYSVSALLAVLFEWAIEQPADINNFIGKGNAPDPDEGESVVLASLMLLGANAYFIVDAPGHHPSWVLNVVFWLALLYAIGTHAGIQKLTSPSSSTTNEAPHTYPDQAPHTYPAQAPHTYPDGLTVTVKSVAHSYFDSAPGTTAGRNAVVVTTVTITNGSKNDFDLSTIAVNVYAGTADNQAVIATATTTCTPFTATLPVRHSVTGIYTYVVASHNLEQILVEVTPSSNHAPALFQRSVS
jgi:hypothetical protein